MRAAVRSLVVAGAVLATATPALAGRSCEEQAPDADRVVRGMELAEHVQRSLDASGAQVVLLARPGQDLSKYGLRYSHLGFAYREAVPPSADDAPDAPPRTVWRVAHKLNECGTGHADVYRQGLGQFFLDTPYRYDAAYVVLSPAAQAALLPVLRDERLVVRMHTPAYSVVAYPWATKYQQSNQWATETLAAALEPAIRTRSQAQAWLQLHDYQPTDLHLGPLTRLGGEVSRANIAFDDHPNGKRFSNHIETTTVDSIFTWLSREGMADKPVAVF